MLKLVAFVAICAVVLAQEPPPPPPPPGQSVNAFDQGPPPPPPPPGQSVNRNARQAPQMPPMPSPQEMGGQAGNLGMQGLGNMPDPTQVIRKAQEVMSQAASGRRRRQAIPI